MWSVIQIQPGETFPKCKESRQLSVFPGVGSTRYDLESLPTDLDFSLYNGRQISSAVEYCRDGIAKLSRFSLNIPGVGITRCGLIEMKGLGITR